jgi:hypothetical protein
VPALARSSQLYSSLLTRSNRRREALAADWETVALFRKLRFHTPGRYRQPLASTLRRLAIDLRALNLIVEAEKMEGEVTELQD